MPKIEIKNKEAFWINGKLIDLTLIEHWGRYQGGAKFHGIRTALSILHHFTKKHLAAETIEVDQVEMVLIVLKRLINYGYYLPPEVFKD